MMRYEDERRKAEERMRARIREKVDRLRDLTGRHIPYDVNPEALMEIQREIERRYEEVKRLIAEIVFLQEQLRAAVRARMEEKRHVPRRWSR